MNLPLEEISNTLNSLTWKDGAFIPCLSLSWVPMYYLVARPIEKLSEKLKNKYFDKSDPSYSQKE